ncbi:ATP-binding cassette domain-containing protein [Tunicatimonas pelagia]|uniref:ATP-binding cassette domain-containing protein n=1 Tax=Tunicatimonas pelagia TaxID=931531 RepID=UPI002665AEE1|nr:ATP-binding cassette domain-containing protein [Tunicatimonas pelagia]WKN45759.1 ATP-binding cassette domain-containing protein [Tunicatimonas pelagia]
MPKPLIKATQIEVKIRSKVVLRNVSFTISEGEAWAVTGPSGSGKTTLANVIRQRQPLSSGKLTSHLSPTERVVMVEQQHTYRNQTDNSSTYYQARFDSMDSVDFPSVEEELWISVTMPKNEEIDRVLQLLQISHLRYSRLIQLSNGENKRFQLAKALLQQPKVLILDSPFIGLDQQARKVLHRIINQLISEQITIVLITTPSEIPNRIMYVLELQENHSAQTYSRASFLAQQPKQITSVATETGIHRQLLARLSTEADTSFEVAIRMHNVSIRYGGKTILDGVNWQVNRGDKWALSGPNGAGKSTLLSLINGDNPQAYANQIYLFDRKKGSGESIWDIKRRIGYVSPELHLYFNRRLSCFEAVASGLTDTLISDKNISTEQKATVAQWLNVFGLPSQQDNPLMALPLSEQRLVLLARALVKNPPVLLLDEPCQGLDTQQTQKFNAIVDTICQHFDKTLIYVSHYEQDIPTCVNQRLFLEKGKASVILD